jgi:hypothetical protein
MSEFSLSGILQAGRDGPHRTAEPTAAPSLLARRSVAVTTPAQRFETYDLAAPTDRRTPRHPQLRARERAHRSFPRSGPGPSRRGPTSRQPLPARAPSAPSGRGTAKGSTPQSVGIEEARPPISFPWRNPTGLRAGCPRGRKTSPTRVALIIGHTPSTGRVVKRRSQTPSVPGRDARRNPDDERVIPAGTRIEPTAAAQRT